MKKVIFIDLNVYNYFKNMNWLLDGKHNINYEMTTYLALESGYQLAVLRENREVEIVVVVSNCNFPSSVYTDSNGVVCDT